MKNIQKPCYILGYCPYGKIVEYFPLHGQTVQWNGEKISWIKVLKKKDISCKMFGHDCPVFHLAEDGTEEEFIKILEQGQMSCSICGRKLQCPKPGK